MEQLRFFLAIALSFLVFFVWEFFFVEKPKTPPQQDPAAQHGEAPRKDAAPVPMQGEPAAEQAAEPVIESEHETPDAIPAVSSRRITIDSPLYHIVITETNAEFESYTLKQYRETSDDDSPLKELLREHISTLRTGFSTHTSLNSRDLAFRADAPQTNIDIAGKPKTITFQSERNGVRIEKTFTFSPDTYLVKMAVTVENRTNGDFTDRLNLSLFKSAVNPDTSTMSRYGFLGPSVLFDNALEQVDPEDIEGGKRFSGEIQWLAVEERYFMTGVLPAAKAPAEVVMHMLPETNAVENRYVSPVFSVAPGTRKSYEFDLFFGPKSTKIMGKMDNSLSRAINFGWFDFIAKPCLAIMNFIHDNIFANYGFAIVVLTILVKMLLWPLGQKHYQSMNDMKKLQPIMAEIREKYKNDKKKMNEELMGIYKTYQINPLGGCLPMALQIPVFLALYRMLYEAIELRHAEFFGWIHDLSAPERLVLFEPGFTVPLMEPPVGVPVLTLIMGATMFWQQKMTPPPGDPTQAKIMMWMPVILIFIFVNLSSGLVLYWLVSNILSIVQSHYISKKATK